MGKTKQFFKSLLSSKNKNQSKQNKKVIEIPQSSDSNQKLTSLPFIITIKNDLDIPIENISLFNHLNENDDLFDKKGNYIKEGLVISSDIPEISYKKVYEYLKNNSVEIGLTHIQSTTENQITESFIFKYQNAQGVFFGKKINPTIDPYQQQTKIVQVQTKYTLDENSSIIYSKINPKTILKIYFYPAKSISLNNPIFKGELKEYFINIKSKNQQIVDFILSKN